MIHFSPQGDPKLFACSCGECDVKPSESFLSKLDEARELAGIAFIVSSGPRCKEYNAEVGGTMTSDHLYGDAADIECSSSSDRLRIVEAALGAGINRIGIGKNFVHLGNNPNNPQNVMWTYYG